MDNNKIYCFIDMFQMYQNVLHPDGTVDKVPVEKLHQYLVNTCYSQNIYNIHFICGNDEYINILITEISEAENTKYSMNKIEFEVN